jgi:hypothetical protein
MQSDIVSSAGSAARRAAIERLFEEAIAAAAGRRAWKTWKQEAAGDLLALTHKAARLDPVGLDLRGDLTFVYRLRMPVPRWPVRGQLQIGREAVFHLVYKESWLWESPEGWEPLGLLFPPDPFHPEAKPAVRGALCLGKLQPGTRPTEIVLLGYYMLSLQAIQLNELDPSGVLNSEACDYFRSHPEFLPLTRAGLYEDLEAQKETP